MVTVYDLAKLILNDILNIYSSSEDDFSEIIKYLNGNSTKYDNVFDSYGNYSNQDKSLVKKVIMLNIFSYAYLVNLYNVRIGLDSETSEKFLDVLNQLNYHEIIDMFDCFSPEIKAFFEDSSKYLTNTYIFKFCCWQNLLAQGKKSQLFKLNPFAFFEQDDISLGDGFVETEVNIQTFDNLYEKALEKASLDPELGEEDDLDNFDILLIEHFNELVHSHFKEDLPKIESFFASIFSNIYENVSLNIKINPKQRKKYKSLMTKFEEYSISDLINMFENSYSFAIDIIDIFFTYNSFLEKGELINRRLDFLKKGNTQMLEQLNPFYEEEKSILKRLKEKGSK